MNQLYNYLVHNFTANEPILVEEIRPEGMLELDIRHGLRALTVAGIIQKYDVGVYYLPPAGIARSMTRPSRNSVIEKKYLKDNGKVVGYFTGRAFAVEMGLSSRLVTSYEIVTNKEYKAHREVTLGGRMLILRRPSIMVNEKNWRILQLLDLIRDMDKLVETSPSDTVSKIRGYMQKNHIKFDDMEVYLDYYPSEIYGNLYRSGLLVGWEDK